MQAQTNVQPAAGGRLQTAFETTKSVVLGPKPVWVQYSIYAAIVGIIIALIVISIDYFHPFLPAGMGPSAAARAGQTFWTSVQAASENLVVPTTVSPTKTPGQWSLSAQIIITDSRTPSAGKFRHILHRGSNPVGISATTTGSTGQAGIQPADLPDSADPIYMSLGLPGLMNPGIFLDKYKNDIHVFIQTKGREEGREVLWLESMSVADIPLNQPMNLGVVCNGRSLDVYVNCRLYSSLLLRGTPYMPAGENQWFGRYGAFPMTGLIKNLTLWPTALGSSDFIQMCRGAGSFSASSLPSACPTSSGSSCAATGSVGSTGSSSFAALARYGK